MAVTIPTEVVGSLPRPLKLQQAIPAYQEGKISPDEFEQIQDEAAKDSLARLAETNETYITDGEQRASSFATYPLVDTLLGKGLASNLAPDGAIFGPFKDGHVRQLPRVTGPFKYKRYAADLFVKSKKDTTYPMKQAVIAPSMISLLYPSGEEVPGYSREQFHKDIVDESERDIRKCFEAGAKRVSIDFTEGRLALKKDPNNPWTGAGLLPFFVDLNNRVLERFTPEERKNIGVHTCPGGDCDSVHSADVPYADLLPSLFQINAGYFLIQCASESDKEAVYKVIGKSIRKDANGVKQVAFIGVVNPLDPRVESPEEIAEEIVRASKHIPVDQLGCTDDCGFSPFSLDLKPNHGSPDDARLIAFKKITNRVKGAKLASQKLSS